MDPITITEINQHIDNAVTNINSNINNVNSYAYNANTYAYNANIYAKNANANAALIPDISNTVINANTYAKNANTHAYNANLTIDTVKILINNLSNDISNINNFVTALDADVGNLSTNINTIKTNAALLPNIDTNVTTVNTHAYNANTYAKNANTYAYNANLNAYNANIYAKNANTTISTVSELVSNISNDLTNLTANINNANLYAYNANLNIASVTSDLSNIAGQLNDVVNQLTTFSTNIDLIPNINTNLTTVNTHAYNANTYAKNANTYAYNSNLNAYNANTYAKNANTNAALIPNIYNSINAQDTLLGTMNTNVTCANTYAKNANTYAYNANIHAYNAEQNAVNILTNTNLIPSLNTNISCSNYWAYMSYMRANAMYNGSTSVNTGVPSHNVWKTVVKTIAAGSISCSITSTSASAKVLRAGSFNFTSVDNLKSYINIFISRPNVTTNASWTSSRADMELIISNYSTTTTSLTGYNNIINATSNLVYHFTNWNGGSGSSDPAGTKLLPSLICIRDNKIVTGSTYYVYFVIRNFNSHPNIQFTITTPKVEIQQYYLSSTETTTLSGEKFAGQVFTTATNTDWCTYPLAKVMGHNNDLIIDINCLYEDYLSHDSAFGYAVINSNIYGVSEQNRGKIARHSAASNFMFVREYY